MTIVNRRRAAVPCHGHPAESLADWPWTSLCWMVRPGDRPAWYDPATALREPMGCADEPGGWGRYIAYLGWMQENEAARRAARFDRMSKGRVVGSPGFPSKLLAERRELALRSGPDLREWGPTRAASLLANLLTQLGKTPDDLRAAAKSAPWKIALAASIRQDVLVSNRWLGEHLHLGSPERVSRNLNAWQRHNRPSPAATAMGKA